MTITTEQFERLRKAAVHLTGIELRDRHHELIARRCVRMKMREPAGLDAVLAAAEGGDAGARRQLIELVTTVHTGFFRNPRHFEVAAEHALQAIREHRAARFWTAAAATGEEPYSLAMALIEALGRNDPPVSILATDINADVLEAARQGMYGESALSGVDTGRRKRFFEPVSAGRWRIVPEARRLVEFRCLNLADSAWPVEGPLDVVFCRNVLMYLEAGRRESALRRIAPLVRPDGLLILDPAEHPSPVQELFSQGKGGVYSPRALPAVMECL
jgi:chemotaxis protein methyltransferase CheR